MFSSKKDTKETKEEDIEVKKTGGEIDAGVNHLLAASYDKNDPVKLTISCALHDIGLKQTELVLTSAVNFVVKRAGKLEYGHRVQIIKIIGSVLEDARDKVSLESAKAIVKFACREMVAEQEVKADWQGPASQILVLLAQPFCDLVVDELMLNFKPGIEPHYFVAKTLGDCATANGVAFTMRMQEVLGRVIPVLGSVKKSPMKWVFSTSLGRFAEAIYHFNANATPEAKSQVETRKFSADMTSAWDVIFSKWIISKESKVRFAVAESLGLMAGTMDNNGFADRLNKIIPTYFAMYKKEKFAEHLPISHGFHATLATAAREESKGTLEPQLGVVLNGLFPFICKPVDYQNPMTSKNHSELLRCFEVCGRAYLNSTLSFIINRFALKEKEIKIGGILLLRHFVNCLDANLDDQKHLIMSSVIKLVVEKELPVRKAILQLIVAMSNHNYLILEGGQTLVKFIVEQCAFQAPGLWMVEKEKVDPKKDKSANPDDVTPAQIRVAASHILYVMASKVVSTHPVLWPYLFELFADKNMYGATAVMTKSLGALAEAKQKDADFGVDWKGNINMPSPHSVVARLLVQASLPTRDKELALTSLSCLITMGPMLHKDLGAYWAQSLPPLVEQLSQQSEADLVLFQWQDQLQKNFKQALELLQGDKPWLREFCEALCKLFPLYNQDHEFVRTLHRFVGAAIAAQDSRVLIASSLDAMLGAVDHGQEAERQGCAQGLGLAGYSHLDVLLPKLNESLAPPKKDAKSSLETKSSGVGGFFASFTDKSSSGSKSSTSDTKTATILLSYGYIVAYANVEIVLARLDVHIMHNLLPILSSASKSPVVRVNLIKALDLIGKAVHQSRLPETKKDWKLQQRDELLTGVLQMMDAKKSSVPVTNEIRLLGLNAAATLVNLQPPLQDAVREAVFDVIVPCFALGLDNVTIHVGDKKDKDKDKKEKEEDSKEEAPANVYEMVMGNLNTLLQALVHMDPTIPALCAMLLRLEKATVSKVATERERAVTSYLVLLKKFISKILHDKAPQTEKRIPELGKFLAKIAARCTDSSLVIRQTATECVQALLFIDQLLENPDNPKPVQEITLMTKIRLRLEAPDIRARVLIIDDLAGLISTVMSIDEIIESVVALLKVVTDPDTDAAKGVAQLVKGLIHQKASQMGDQLEPILSTFIVAVKSTIPEPEVCSVVLEALRILVKCKTHFDGALKIFLKSAVPLSEEIAKCFLALVPADDPELALATIKNFFTVLNDSPQEVDKSSPVVMAATSALATVLSQPIVKELLAASYPALFSSLLMRVGTAQGVDDGQSSKDAVLCLRVFLETMGEKDMLLQMELENVWEGLSKKNYDDSVTKCTKIFCTVHGEMKRNLIKFLSRFYSQQSFYGQRVVATALLAEFVNHSSDDCPLLKELIKLLLPRVADKIDKVRKQALRGLGNLVTVWNEEVVESAPSVLSCLNSACEDTDADVAAEAVDSLTRIVNVIEEEIIGPMLINICFRMRASFDRKDPTVRAANFTLFGALCRFGAGQGKSNAGLVSNFLDQLHPNLPLFIMHLVDEEEVVRTACAAAFIKVADLLDQSVKDAVASAPTDEALWDTFVTQLCPLLTTLYPNRIRAYIDGCQEYFNSKWMSVRGNSAVFAATLVAVASPEVRKGINVNALFQSLVKLLQHENPLVRTRSAKALSLLWDV